MPFSINTYGPGPSFPSLSGSRLLYVDGNRTDSYSPNGTIAFPFKDIQSAVNQVITNGDGAANPYCIKIAPSTYAGNLTFNSALLGTLLLSAWGDLSSQDAINAVSITGTVTSNASNTGTNLGFEGLNFSSAITFSGLNGASFNHCNFGGGASPSATGMIAFDLFNCHGQCNWTIGTTTCNWFNNSLSLGTFNFNNGASVTAATCILSSTITIASGASVIMQEGSATAGGTTVTVQSGGSLTARNSIIRGTLTVNAGGTATITDTFVQAFSGVIGSDPGSVFPGSLVLVNAAPTVGASTVALGNGKAATATAGAGAAPPATVDSYLIINDAGTAKKIPIYLA